MTQAASALGLDHFTPYDIELDAGRNILLDDGYHAILKLCWSGLIGLACLALQCTDFSRLTLRPGVPKPLIPGLTPEEQSRVDESVETHARAHQRSLTKAASPSSSSRHQQ